MDAEEKIENKEQDGLYKLGVTREAEKILGDVVNKVNDGYQGGKASRTGVASWLITQFGKIIDGQHIKTMRLEFLNEISLLELVLRKSKEVGHLSPELKKLLLAQVGLLDEPVRRSAKGKASDDLSSESNKEVA